MAWLGLVALLGVITCVYTTPDASKLMPHDLLSNYIREHRPEAANDKQVTTVLKAIRDGREDQGTEEGDAKSGRAAVKKGGVDRGFVSDLIDSALSGMHLGLSIGSANGTTNSLCIKLGNVTMAGCRRTAPQQDKSSEIKPIEIQLGQNADDLPISSDKPETTNRKGRRVPFGGIFRVIFRLLMALFKNDDGDDN